jgi:predicted AAA+ superfamily ATPase
MIKRYIEKHIVSDIKDKMVFISGPRQVGKTTLAKGIGTEYYSGRYEYLNWDNREDRKTILNGIFKADKKLFIFDEIHKYKNWKNYLKGEFDKYKEQFNILVTGSSRLDMYRKSGDSLLGRYRHYRLHPLSVAELLGTDNSSIIPCKELQFTNEEKKQREYFNALFKFGGFPEVFLKKSEKALRLWHNERTDIVVKEDIRDIESIRDLSALQILIELLPAKVGSLFSLNSLREDLNVTHKTVALWVDVLEKFYYHYRIYPFQTTLVKSIRKEPKLYLWDWSEVTDEEARLENIVASHLLKFCHFLFDVEGYKAQLFFLKDKEQREVDFLITVENKPWFCVEVKRTFKGIPPPLRYFSEKLKIPFTYEVVDQEDVDLMKDKVRIMSVHKFLSALV